MQKNSTDIDILYSDSELVVINKPGGLLSVPGRGADKQDCVVSRLKRHFPGMIEQPSTHRLDMYTSGLMVVAITRETHRALSKQFERKEVYKQYLALLEGRIEQSSGEIHLPFRVDLNNRPYQIYDPVHGKMGITHWQRLAFEGDRTRIEFTPLTGRTHQLRVHAAHPLGLGTPIVGDYLYGNCKDGDQMMLHASHLRFFHPTSNQWCSFDSPPPF